jgi:hypothetical protein
VDGKRDTMSLSEVERPAADATPGPSPRARAGMSGAAKPGPSSARIDAALTAIAAIDLAAVKRKVVEEKAWNRKIADYAELRYRRFLAMYLLDRKLALVPPPDIDVFWHQHILFTREYARDCENAFGEFLHHSPAMGRKDEAEELQQGFAETAAFYADAFGENYLATEPEGLSARWVELFD